MEDGEGGAPPSLEEAPATRPPPPLDPPAPGTTGFADLDDPDLLQTPWDLVGHDEEELEDM